MANEEKLDLFLKKMVEEAAQRVEAEQRTYQIFSPSRRR